MMLVSFTYTSHFYLEYYYLISCFYSFCFVWIISECLGSRTRWHDFGTEYNGIWKLWLSVSMVCIVKYCGSVGVTVIGPSSCYVIDYVLNYDCSSSVFSFALYRISTCFSLHCLLWVSFVESLVYWFWNALQKFPQVGFIDSMSLYDRAIVVFSLRFRVIFAISHLTYSIYSDVS